MTSFRWSMRMTLSQLRSCVLGTTTSLPATAPSIWEPTGYSYCLTSTACIQPTRGCILMRNPSHMLAGWMTFIRWSSRKKVGNGSYSESPADAGTQWGTGGMRTKIIAAKIASAAGVHTAIIHGEHPGRIHDILDWDQRYQKEIEDSEAAQPEDYDKNYERSDTPTMLQAEELAESLGIGRGMDVGVVTAPRHVAANALPYVGTVFCGNPVSQHLQDQRRWILSLPVRGKLFVDSGAAQAVIVRKKSLFAAGVVRVEGDFLEGEAVSIFMASEIEQADEAYELARCLVNFNSRDLARVKGLRSERFKSVLNSECHPEVAIRSNIIFVNPFVVYDRGTDGLVHTDSDSSDTEHSDNQDDPHDSDPRLSAVDARRHAEKWCQAANAL
eukprot:Polyplicarium_translucidae@DN2694_c0_g1_i2.p2